MKRFCPECNSGNDPRSVRCAGCGCKLPEHTKNLSSIAWEFSALAAIALTTGVAYILRLV